MIRAIVLAAGASSRMGQAKAALPLGPTGETVVARVVRTLLTAGLPSVTVVAGAHIDAVRAAMPAFEPRARVIEHLGWAQGQLSSLLAGLAAVDDPQLEAILVTLADVPLVRPESVSAIVHAWRQTRAPIVRPVDGDRHGHPVVFDRTVFDDLRHADQTVGAKAVFATHASRRLDVPIKDDGAFVDMDTPDDYRTIQNEPSR
ncbi:MAG: nucleotidyltransferase family protein [Acidobacteria bacterium]|nr:nucleotidyltransferase family protein [Acidobacteriota bacterium]MSO82319.1 nucleotidyltransferase family protein [Acidobacteriota bacterium]